MKSCEICSRLGHQRCQFGHEIKGLEQHVRRPIPIASSGVHLSIIRWDGTRISEDNTQDIARNTSRHSCSDCSKNAIFQLNFPDGTQLQIADFPSGAVRESVANALLHSDYRRGGAIVIEHNGDSLRITSPGRLPQEITTENILAHSSQPRNTRLFVFAKLIEIAEEQGLGVDRMVRESINAGNPGPQIIEQGENTMVVFTKGKRNRSFINYILSMPAN